MIAEFGPKTEHAPALVDEERLNIAHTEGVAVGKEGTEEASTHGVLAGTLTRARSCS